MLLLYILILWPIEAVTEHQLNMYNTNDHRDGHCLSFYLHRNPPECQHSNLCGDFINTVLMMSYCFRPVEDDDLTIDFDFQHSAHSNFTFAQLREKNVTSQMLLLWSASIDMAERYQIFLNNHSDSPSDYEEVFHNCTSSWFGPLCRFKLELIMLDTFTRTAFFFMEFKSEVHGDAKITCYIHLTCQTLLSCLDWREICDGKQDCLDGADEKNCWQLEVNQCKENEYRCSNGQCIPIEYVHDDSYNSDCLDRTDEEPYSIGSCYQNPDFICEEHTCRPGKEEFPCGDGQCISEVDRCYNGRHGFLPSSFCSSAAFCSMELYNQGNYDWCSLFCSKTNCLKDNCPDIYDFRHLPLLFGHVRFMISGKGIDSNDIPKPDYVCYDAKLCAHLPSPTAPFNNLICRQFDDLRLQAADSYSNLKLFVNDVKDLFRGCLVTVNETHYCNYSTMYQCENSTKCISKHRLLDGIGDCPFNDDETYNQSCSLNDIHQRFKCRDERNEKCFTLLAMKNGKEECRYGEDEYRKLDTLLRTRISFPAICDGFIHLLPLFIDGQNETDETECETWECNNTYSQCNSFWLCKNGADEISCSPSTCPEQHHSCVFPNDTSKVSCLPIAQAGDDNDNCLGGTDERTKYHVDYGPQFLIDIGYRFHCWNDTKIISTDELCNNRTDCRFNDDETFCKSVPFKTDRMCVAHTQPQTDVENFFCELHTVSRQKPNVLFKLHNVLSYPSPVLEDHTLITSMIRTKTRLVAKNLINIPSYDVAWLCNRGLPIRLQMTEKISTLSCLCPPSYYGDKCQYQNQRVSLTIQVRVASEWRSIFLFLVTLVDNEKNIESHNYIEYLPVRDCTAKFNMYLLYITRPKNASKFYSVQIDAFNEVTLKYRASWIFPLRFPFLPVQRLAVLLRVPFVNAIFVKPKCSPPCVHGQCFHYVNDQNLTFCHCERGWSGLLCNVKHVCECATDSLCVSHSICLCPPGRFGARCHLYQSPCDPLSCLNDGQCAPTDARYTYYYAIPSMCMCPEGYVGEHCEHQLKQTRIDISFHQQLTIPSSLLVHFIAARDHLGQEPNRATIAKKLRFDQYSLTIYTSTSFNIAITQMSRQYYLIVLREQTITSANISTEIIPSHRCQSLDELFNDTFTKQHLLKRIKHYHLPCKLHKDLICFYDDIHICLCTLDRTANCFEFDHNKTYECDKYKYCGNDGYCFQDDFECPTSSFCTCDRCYFGSRCQFSTKASALSLDIILGYHFRSTNNIDQQPTIVKIATTLTSIIFALGIINSFLSFQTFRGKQVRTVGCGLYLFTSSIVSMITVITLSLKFVFLVAVQVGSIKSRLFLQIQCVSMDFLLRSLLSTIDWLSACVAIERVVNVTQGVKFNKTKSKLVAKWTILIVLLCTSCSYIYDSVHHHVMDDEEEEEEQRTWCLSQYSSSVQVFDRLLNIFHFSVPFAINGISAVLIIIIAARTRSNVQKTKPFKEHLREQLHHHKHLLISPLILVVLSLPRLVLSFLPGCMGSPRESWFYLIGYFISFIPSILTFGVFVLPSEVYMKEFTQYMRRLCHR